MSVYLVRHALAGDKRAWEGPDERRPLTQRGRRQARGLVELLAGSPVDRVVSSPRARCVQTVQPLADARGLPVEHAAELDVGAGPATTIPFLLAAAGVPTVHCSHREVIAEVLRTLAEDGLAYDGELVWAKGSAWVLEAEGGRFARGRYLPPHEPPT